MSYLSRRVARLERVAWLMRPRSLQDEWDAALDEAALRLTGRRYQAVHTDPAVVAKIFEGMNVEFLERLSDEDLNKEATVHVGSQRGRSEVTG